MKSSNLDTQANIERKLETFEKELHKPPPPLTEDTLLKMLYMQMRRNLRKDPPPKITTSFHWLDTEDYKPEQNE